jgi:hypothetical protein
MIVADATPIASAQNLTKRAPFGNATNFQPLAPLSTAKKKAMDFVSRKTQY